MNLYNVAGNGKIFQNGSIFAGGLNILQNNGMKSVQELQQRQQKANSQIEFYEAQKENLSNVKADTVEGIERKLEKVKSYEDSIAAVKMQYNNEQMFHLLEEAREKGEEIAKATEENAPKTAEERKDEMVEEALGTEDENDGMLSEVLEEAAEIIEEMEEGVEHLTEQQGEELKAIAEVLPAQDSQFSDSEIAAEAAGFSDGVIDDGSNTLPDEEAVLKAGAETAAQRGLPTVLASIERANEMMQQAQEAYRTEQYPYPPIDIRV